MDEEQRLEMQRLARLQMERAGAGQALDRLRGQTSGYGSQSLNRAQRTPAQNPYDMGMADQTRAAQLALMQQMEAARTGPSLAAMQGRGAMGQSTQQALAAGALGQGRGVMLGAGQASAGLAGDVARARMIEDLKVRAGIGGAASQLRGQDISSATQQLRAGQQSQALSDEMARFYGSQALGLENLRAGAELDQYKLQQQLAKAEQERADQARAQGLNVAGSILGGLF